MGRIKPTLSKNGLGACTRTTHIGLQYDPYLPIALHALGLHHAEHQTVIERDLQHVGFPTENVRVSGMRDITKWWF